jgi:peptidoglycan/LPS O-acetylase OafA/YrhL
MNPAEPDSSEVKAPSPTYHFASSFRWTGLDGLRALAVMLVMIGHYGHRTAVGSLGVGLFYVLSGFLITWLLEREYLRSQRINLSWFYMRRALRIVPALYLFLLVNLLVLPRIGVHLGLDEWLASALYVNDYFSALHYRPSTALTHTWSLGVEEKFYVIWPPVYWISRRISLAMTRRLLIALFTIVVVWRAALLLAFQVRPHYAQFAFDCRLDYLAAGCFLALMTTTSAAQGRLPDRARRHAAWAGLYAVCGLAVLTATLSSWKWYWISFPLEYCLLAILLFSVTRVPDWIGWRFLEWPLLRWLGTISYSAYLYHKVTWLLLRESALPALWCALAAGVLTTVPAAASYYGLERFFLRKKKRYTPA